jgi:hypothetical protein
MGTGPHPVETPTVAELPDVFRCGFGVLAEEARAEGREAAFDG